MNDLQTFLAIVGSLVLLAGVGGVLYAQARASQRDATETRLRRENEDYLRRLNFVEPKLAKAEEQNALLMTLHNPTAKLEELSGNDKKILEILAAQGLELRQIHTAVSGGDEQ